MLTRAELKEILKESPLFIWTEERDVDIIALRLYQYVSQSMN